MSEIERAIKFLGYIKGYDIQSANLAIEALREQAERSKGQTRVKLTVMENPTSLFEYACGSCEAYLFASDAFCPACGKRLEVEQ